MVLGKVFGSKNEFFEVFKLVELFELVFTFFVLVFGLFPQFPVQRAGCQPKTRLGGRFLTTWKC